MVCGERSKLNLSPTKDKRIFRGNVSGIDVIQITLPYSNKDRIPKRVVTFLQFAWYGIRIALDEQYDLLFATSTPLTAAIPGIVAKVFKKKPFVFEVRDLWPELPKALGLKNPVLLFGMSVLEYMSYRIADSCIGLSPGICEGIKERAQKGKRVIMIPNGCDLDIFTPGRRVDLHLKGINPTDTVAVYIGAHGVPYGLDMALDAALVLKDRNRLDIKIVFFGDGKLKSGLEDRANRENITNCLFFDSISKTELGKYMSNMDIGLMILANIPAFYYGTSPNKFFDYISSGLPVLNNYPGWLADLITHNRCGVVVEPDDPVKLAEGLIFLADNPDVRKKLGVEARKLAESSFSRDLFGKEFVQFIEDTYELCVPQEYRN